MTKHFRNTPAIVYVLAVSLSFTVMTVNTTAANYIKPEQTAVPFKLEKIPLQLDSMKELSKHLVTLSCRKHDNSADQLRTTAQMLALAMLLDPANQDARETNRLLIDDILPRSPPEASILKAKARLRFYNRWLGNTDAGADANLLSGLLTDATKTLHPDTLNNADIANWTGVVASLDKYEKSTPKPGDDKMAEGRQGDETPDTPVTPPPVNSTFHFTEMSLRSPIELMNYEKYVDPRDDREKTRTNITHGISTIGLTLTPCKPNEQRRFKINSIERAKQAEKEGPIFKGTRGSLLSLLTNRHNALPNYKINVLISGGLYGKSNGLALTAPLALMLESSLNNTPLRKDIHICAVVDKKGNLTMPKNFWQTLAAIRKSPTGGRLIVPAAAYEMLAQTLVYGKPDFLTRWEILAADSLDEALAVATQKSTADLNLASEYFETVQGLARKNDVTKIAVNHAVRSRLAEILKLAPNHLSSRVLLLQGSGKRPMRLSEKALAHELLPVIKKMNNALQHQLNIDHLSVTKLRKTHEESRASLDEIDSLVDRSYDDLYQAALHQANEFRRLMTIARRDQNSNNEKARSLFLTMRRDTKTLLGKTLVAAGFPAPEPIKVDK